MAAYVDGLSSSTAAQSASGTISVRNLSDGNALASSFNFNLALGPDYSVTPWTWPTQSIWTTSTYGYVVTPLHTLTGFNQPVTLRFSAANLVGAFNAGGMLVAKNGSTVASYSYISDPSGYVDVTYQPNDIVHIYLDVHGWEGPVSGSAQIQIRNLSDSNTLVSSFTLDMAVDQ